MNLLRYVELVAEGAIKLDRIGPSVVCTKRDWDNETGKEKEPEVLVVSLVQLDDELKKLEEQKNQNTAQGKLIDAQIEASNAFIADVKALLKD